jgi:protein SCO1/2
MQAPIRGGCRAGLDRAAAAEHQRTVNLAATAARRAGALVHDATGRPLAWLALVAVLAGWPMIWSLRTAMPAPPPVLGTVPGFAGADRHGRPFGSGDLAGRVWVASLAASPCDPGCAAAAAAMGRVQARTRQLEPALHLVSFTGDADAARLADLARAHRASPRMWTFVAGQAPAGVARAGQLVLVDGEARIRGAYDPAAPDAVERLVRDAALLVNRR